jgi:hypothetical protein
MDLDLFMSMKPAAFMYLYAPGPDLFTSGIFLRLKLVLPVGLAGAAGPVLPHAGLTQQPDGASTGNPNFNTQKEVLVMRVVLTARRRR